MSLSQKKLSLTLRDAGPGLQIQAPLELALAALDQAGSHRKASAAKVWPSRPRHTGITQAHNCRAAFPALLPRPPVLGEWRVYGVGSLCAEERLSQRERGGKEGSVMKQEGESGRLFGAT